MNVLIVIDMLNDFIDEKGVLSLGEPGTNIIAPIAEKIRNARLAGEPVIYLCDAHDEDDIEFERFPAHAVKGTWGSQIISDLLPLEGEEIVIQKKRYSGFYGTCLQATLAVLAEESGEELTVEVVGCCTSICIAETVEDLVNRDYAVVIDRNAVADFNQDAHKFFLDYQFPKIFDVTVK